jgi:hypothetical protein
MFLNIGNGCLIRTSAIVGIFDMDNATWSRWTRRTLETAEQSGALINAAEDEIPNAFILCHEQGKQTVYLSMLTAATLRKRAGEPIF